MMKGEFKGQAGCYKEPTREAARLVQSDPSGNLVAGRAAFKAAVEQAIAELPAMMI